MQERDLLPADSTMILRVFPFFFPDPDLGKEGKAYKSSSGPPRLKTL